MGGDQTRKLAEALKGLVVMGSEGVIDPELTRKMKGEILEIFDQNDPDRFEIVGSMTAGPIKCLAVTQRQADTGERGPIEYRYYLNGIMYAQLPTEALKLLEKFRETTEERLAFQAAELADYGSIPNKLEHEWNEACLAVYTYASSDEAHQVGVELSQETRDLLNTKADELVLHIKAGAANDGITIPELRVAAIRAVIGIALEFNDETRLPSSGEVIAFVKGEVNKLGEIDISDKLVES